MTKWIAKIVKEQLSQAEGPFVMHWQLCKEIEIVWISNKEESTFYIILVFCLSVWMLQVFTTLILIDEPEDLRCIIKGSETI